jgi:hypothetical protein
MATSNRLRRRPLPDPHHGRAADHGQPAHSLNLRLAGHSSIAAALRYQAPAAGSPAARDSTTGDAFSLGSPDRKGQTATTRPFNF